MGVRLIVDVDCSHLDENRTQKIGDWHVSFDVPCTNGHVLRAMHRLSTAGHSNRVSASHRTEVYPLAEAIRCKDVDFDPPVDESMTDAGDAYLVKRVSMGNEEPA